MRFTSYEKFASDEAMIKAFKLAIKAKYYYDKSFALINNTDEEEVGEEKYNEIKQRKTRDLDTYIFALKFLEALLSADKNDYCVEINCIDNDDALYVIEDTNKGDIFYIGKYDAWV